MSCFVSILIGQLFEAFGMLGMACNEDAMKYLRTPADNFTSAQRLLAEHATWRRVERTGGQECVGQQCADGCGFYDFWRSCG